MTERTVRIDVGGMTCANCSGTVEDALLGVDGVSGADANYATDAASVTYDPSRTDLAAVHGAVADAGYDPVTAEMVVPVRGMTCANCSSTVEDALDGVPGVVAVAANVATDEAHVTYSPGAFDREAAADAVEDAGYEPVREADGTNRDADRSAADEARQAEVRRERNRTLFGALLSAPLLLFVADTFLLGGSTFPETLSLGGVELAFGWVEFALATPVYVVLGRVFLRNAYTALVRNRTANMDVLVALGSTTAYVYSIVALLEVLPGAGLYFDTAALILAFLTLGNYLEARSKGRAGDALRQLLEMEADTARVVAADGEEREVPVSKEPGDEVVGSTINENGVLVVEATKVGADTAIQQVVDTVREAQSRQPDIQTLADRISSYFVPAVVANALFWGVAWFLAPGALADVVAAVPLWGLVGGGPAAVGALEFGVVVFASAVLIACPCALGLATPAATMVGTSIGASNGVLFEGGDVLERVTEVDAVVFDKTGTLTTGEMALTDVEAVDAGADAGAVADGGAVRKDVDESFVLRTAAAAESSSEHPLGEAIVAGAAERSIDVQDVEDFENVPGKGVRATVEGREVLVGNRALLGDEGVDTAPAEAAMERVEREGKTAMLVAAGGRVVGVVAAADTVKESATRAVGDLRERGLAVHVITGDNERTARAVAEEVGVDPDNVRAGVLPDEKADVIRHGLVGNQNAERSDGAIRQSGADAMMVGDGVNDAPALAAAHVGVAIGSGTDVAIEAADVTLLRDDPYDVVEAVRVGEGTLAKIKQNLFWALGYNTAMIPLASLGLLQPVLAAGAMAVSSVSVLANSLLFRRYTPDEDYRLFGR